MHRFNLSTSFTVYLGLVVSFQVQTVLGESYLNRKDVDSDWTTDPAQFYRRKWHSSVIIGDTIYIDGGEVWRKLSDGLHYYAYNSTYSLDLSSSWSPSEARFHMIDKGDCPILNRPNLWTAPDEKSYYSVNGDVSSARPNDEPPDPPEIWHFTPDDNSSGTWRRARYLDGIIGSSGAKSVSGNGSAYVLGGYTLSRTTPRYGSDSSYVGSADGILSWNMSDSSLLNQSMTAFVPSGWWYEGELHWVDNLGGSGLVVALGGVTAASSSELVEPTFKDFSQVAFFHPATGDWLTQSTTTPFPPSRRRACSIGVPGDNGTYEIFVHGGSAFPENTYLDHISQSSIDLDQVWILSLPSFTWAKADYKAKDARYVHTCHVVGNPPQRQMLAVGGATPNLNSTLESKDPWPQGLGIFDMTDLQWVTSYDATAPMYVTPQLVKDGIAKNGFYPKSWDDQRTALWLTGRSVDELEGRSGASSPSSKPALSTGAIAGVVVSTVGSIALVAFLIWNTRIKRKRPSGASCETEKSKPANEQHVAGDHELSGSNVRHELPAEPSDRVSRHSWENEVFEVE